MLTKTIDGADGATAIALIWSNCSRPSFCETQVYPPSVDLTIPTSAERSELRSDVDGPRHFRVRHNDRGPDDQPLEFQSRDNGPVVPAVGCLEDDSY